MIRKLKAKGYTSSTSNKDVLEGEFNGTNVNIHVVTNNNKVCRIMVADANMMNESNIKIRFNNLCQQFQNNKQYTSLLSEDYTLSDDEDISYQMTVKNKRYEAAYYQVDSVAMAEEAKAFLSKNYTEEQLSNLTEEMMYDLGSYMMEIYKKKSVWFMIVEHYGKYYITMFYDNGYNQANGKDL
jgi:hypothetical protein